LREKVLFGQREGVALIAALIILLLLTLVGATIMMVSVNEQKTVSDRIDEIATLAYAKAGVAEAVRRLSLDPSDELFIGDDHYPYNPDWKVYIVLSDELPSLEPPTYVVSSVQTSLDDSLRIRYTTEELDTLYSLSVHHKRNPDNDKEIYYYNWEKMRQESHDPVTYHGKYFPVEVIRATGMTGTVKKCVIVEAARRSLGLSGVAALSCDSPVHLLGKVVICGHNHLFTTPWGTDGGGDHFECFDDRDDSHDHIYHIPRTDGQIHADKGSLYRKDEQDWKCSGVGCVPGISAPGQSITVSKNSIVRGNPDRVTDAQNANFLHLYEMLGMRNWEELEGTFSWIHLEPGVLSGGSYSGFYFCDGDITFSGVVNFTGVLWVKGKVTQKGNFLARGIIYSEKDVRFDGNVWILGTVCVEGEGKIIRPFNGSGVLLYSYDGMERALGQALGYRIISRR
jgi:hypothetical protein